jgi:hypothetical protein
VLPTRVVEFTESEMIWSCQSERLCKCRIGHHHDTRKDKQAYHRALLRYETEPAVLRAFWHSAVREYCSRTLTYPLDDKRPAISGIAKQIHQVTNSKYYAGIWEHSAVSDLLWKPYFSWSIANNADWTPKAYQAPSWSWASLNRRIVYDPEVFNDDAQLRVQILSIGTMLTTINLVGSPSDGYLIAKGYTIVARKRTTLSDNSVPTSDHVVHLDLPNNEELSFTPGYPSALHYPDTRVPVSEVTILLMIAERRYHTSISASLLLLRPLLTQRGSYQRIGCRNHYFDDSEELLKMSKVLTVRIV